MRKKVGPEDFGNVTLAYDIHGLVLQIPTVDCVMVWNLQNKVRDWVDLQHPFTQTSQATVSDL
jgi:hypothetical protein